MTIPSEALNLSDVYRDMALLQASVTNVLKNVQAWLAFRWHYFQYIING
jgi:hypothetical protein